MDSFTFFVLSTAAVVLVVILLFIFLCSLIFRKGKSKNNYQDDEHIKVEIDKDQARMDEEYFADLIKSGLDNQLKPGKIQYSLEYNPKNQQLIVGIKAAMELLAMDLSGTSDPYVKVKLMPDNKKFETHVVKKNLNPRFNETFTYQVPNDEIKSKTILLEVYDFDRFSKHDQIGKLNIPLSSIDLNEIFTEIKELETPDDNAEEDHLGDVCFSLKYNPADGELEVVILEAKNIKKMDLGGMSDPFIKILLVQNGKRINKKQTSVKQNTLNPYFNENFKFNVSLDEMKKTSLVVAVFDYDRVGTSDAIGAVSLGAGVKGPGQKHWTDMLKTARKPVAQWHVLEEFVPVPKK